jgi:hypothetical protein
MSLFDGSSPIDASVPAAAPMGATLADVLHVDSRFIGEFDQFGWATIMRLWNACERPYAPEVLKKFLNESIYALTLKKIRYPKILLRRLKELQAHLEGKGQWPPEDERRSASGFESVRDIVRRNQTIRRNLGHTQFSDYMAGVGEELESAEGRHAKLLADVEKLRERDRRKAAGVQNLDGGKS